MFEDIMTNIAGYAAMITPAVAAVVSTVVSIIVGIKKIKSAANDCVSETKDMIKDQKAENAIIRQNINEVLRQNAELKKENALLKKKELGLYIDPNEIKKED